MAKAFKKGDLVTFIADWDRKGTVYYRQAVVYSCGTKKMVLTDEATGGELGCNFKPQVGSLVSFTAELPNGFKVRTPAGGTFPRMTDEEAEAACLAVAASIRKDEEEHYARCLAGDHGEAYDAGIRKEIERFHEFRALKR